MLELKDVLVISVDVFDGDSWQHFGIRAPGLSLAVIADFVGREMLEFFMFVGDLIVIIFQLDGLDCDIIEMDSSLLGLVSPLYGLEIEQRVIHH